MWKKLSINAVWLTAAVTLMLFCREINGQTREYLDLPAIEKQMLDLVNRERADRGLSLLEENRRLAEAALKHSQKMAEEEQLSHDFPDYKSLGQRLEDVGLFFVSAGENVAYSQVYSAQTIHQGFMESPSHRDNILDPRHTHCGIRAVEKGKEIYLTQEFARLFTPLSRDEIVVILKEDLALWYVKKYGYPLIFFDQVARTREFADLGAREQLSGRSISPFTDKWGSYYSVRLVSPDIEKLRLDLREQAGKVDFRGAEIGVAFGKQPTNPGGTYSVIALLFPGNRYGEKNEQELIRLVLAEVNRFRIENGGRLFTYTGSRESEGKRAARAYYEQPDKPVHPVGRGSIVVYQTHDLQSLPGHVEEFLMHRKADTRIGIGLFSPLANHLPGNFFIVALVLAN